MLTLNDTPLEDNQLVWVMKIYLDSGTLYLADRDWETLLGMT